MHQGFKSLDNYEKYPEANKVLEKCFFLGSAPHYSENVFEYIKEVVDKF
jgi:hypothetical protein